MAQTQDTRILDRFTGYSVADCDCKLCLYYGGKRLGCTLSACCCTEERQQAYKREGLEKAALVCRG